VNRRAAPVRQLGIRLTVRVVFNSREPVARIQVTDEVFSTKQVITDSMQRTLLFKAGTVAGGVQLAKGCCARL
jgi:hypothetical protein